MAKLEFLSCGPRDGDKSPWGKGGYRVYGNDPIARREVTRLFLPLICQECFCFPRDMWCCKFCLYCVSSRRK